MAVTISIETLGEISRSDQVRPANRRRVLSCLRRSGRASRSQIAQQTGLSAATLTAVANELIAFGAVTDGPPEPHRPSRRGRPQTALALDGSAGCVVTLNLQLDALFAVAHNYREDIIARRNAFPMTRKLSQGQLRRDFIRAIDGVLKAGGVSRRDLRRIAVGVQGVTDADHRILRWAPITPLRDLEVSCWLEHEFGVPTSVCNDGELAARALMAREAEPYADAFAAILLAHGVGMGLVMNGQPLSGTRSSGAEFGHMIHIPNGALCRCGSRGCIEAYAGDYAIKRRAEGGNVLSEPVASVPPESVSVIAHAARNGDQRAIAALEEAAEAIGVGLVSLFALIDPLPVMLIGNVAAARDLLEPKIRATIARNCASRMPSAAGEDLGQSLHFEWRDEACELILEGGANRALADLDDEIADAPV